MKIVSLKRKSIPKVAVLVAGLAAAVMVATVNMAPAQARPTETSSCSTSGCHTAGGSVIATPSSATPVGGAAYTVTLAYTGGTGDPVGYRITRTGETAVFASDAGPADMTAPAAVGTYTYTVWMRSGDVVADATYEITVSEAAPATTAPATTAPATTAPATAAPATAAPATDEPTVAPTVASAVVPVGGAATGAGGAAQSNDSPLMGFGGLALLLSGAAMVTGIRRRRQV